MLAQLKTVVLIKEAIKLAFFRLVEYLEHQYLWDAGILDRVAKKKPHLRLANKKKRLRWGKRPQTLDRGTLPRGPAYRCHLFTVDIETG